MFQCIMYHIVFTIKVRTLLYQLKIYDDRIRVELNYDLFLNDKFTSNNALIISIRDIA